MSERFAERVRHSVECKWFDADDAAEYRTQIGAILSRAVRNGAPFPELQGENGAHVDVDVADALAGDGQDVFETDSWDWKHVAWYEFERQLAPRLAAPERQLLARLVHGRPIFGRRFDTDWEFYTYLTNPEARAFQAAVETAIATGPPVTIAPDRDFAGELVGWLGAIAGRGLDVWVLAE